MARRVVVTGIGTVNPVGNDIASFWSNVQAGKSGIGPITRFDTSEYPSKIAGEVRDFDPTMRLEKKVARKMDLFTLYALTSAIEAMEDAGLEKDSIDPLRIGVVLGNGIGGFNTLEESYWKLFEKGPNRIPPMTIPKLIPNEAAGNIAIQYNAQGPCFTVATACASGTDAIGNSLRLVREGVTDVMITGGTEAAIVKMGVAGFCVIQALSTQYNDTPEKASRPFDKDRDGFVMSEGAGIMVLEEYEHAMKRGAPIYAEVIGYGNTCDANHLTAPHPEGRGSKQAIQAAMADANLKPEEVDYFNAHGTSTPMNDPLETKAIKAAMGDHAYKLKISSTKSMTGHLIGAAGAVEGIVCALSIKDQYIPATINLDEADPECDLDYVPNQGIKAKVNVALSNSLGFGGHNGVLAFRRLSD
ncbi:MAG: beta-ketoacyl-ACP synthase II [Spirochaetales bacterium]|nr:beta-ketoacyl-ACP synthase II [Spirochaetales bacterium]MCF7937504.1 beta-ketoacyl-ACP synthase II [Spirochaetales bacterium]